MVHPRVFIRQRWVLGAILGTSIFYFTYNIAHLPRDLRLKESNYVQFRGENSVDMDAVLRKLKWHSEPANSSTEAADKSRKQCKNSVQGKELVADNRGYVCRRDDLTSRGCCDTDAIFTNRYDCDSCAKSNCCVIYEHCISCCMRPDQKFLLQSVIKGALSPLSKMLYTNIDNQFELCMTKCRTSSSSVQQENTYRDSFRKHCYGTSPPELHLKL